MRKLNQVGMDYTVFYMFFLLLLVSIPSFIKQLLDNSGIIAELNFFLFIIYFFIFFYLPFVLIIFGLISLLAYIAVLITKMLQRKLRFSILWKLLAYSTTIPFMFYIIVALFYDFSILYLTLTALYSLTLVIIMILSFPKRRT